MAKVIDSKNIDTGGVLSPYQLLTLYFPGFVLALGYSLATPAIPVFAKSFDTGFGVASLVIVMSALGELVAAVPTGFLVDRLGRRPILFAGPILTAVSSFLTAVARGRVFGFWRLIGQIAGLVSPALFAVVAEQIAYGAAFAFFAFCSLATAARLAFTVKETVGRGNIQ